MRRRETRGRKATYVDEHGLIKAMDIDQVRQFRPGRWMPRGPEEPDLVPDAPDFVVTGSRRRYFGWTHWGDPGVTARSAMKPTPKAAYEDLRDAIHEIRELMMSGRAGDEPAD